MCGIWTLINLSKGKVTDSNFLKDLWNIKKRGPDNTVFITFNNVYLAFHRLAVMDTSFKSIQPYIYNMKDKTIVFICNGEIYNYSELDEKYNLNIGSSDCKTIPELYIKLGEEKWAKLFNREVKGEYAFVLLEFNKLKNLQKVVVGRDMIGIRPLYFHKPNKDSKQLIFSSEIKGTMSFKDNIMEFPPGNIYSYNVNEFADLSLKKYNFEWVYDVKQVYNKDISWYLGNVRRAVTNAVKRRLNSDRPLAFLVSGGVDSSLVAGIAAKLMGKPLNTFCCGMVGGTDLKYAKLVANHIKSNHKEVYFTKEEGLKSLDEVVYCTETWDTTTVRASVGQFLVSKHIGTMTDCRVVLVGEGPDEVCSSYLFNFYAPNGEELHNTALEYVKKLHYFDCRRGDRCVSYWGLEGRVPLLDPEVIEAYWMIPSEYRHPKYKGIEKWWLRKAFDGYDVIPNEVLWRKKEAFSDGVSSKEDSWYTIIQSQVDKHITEKDMKEVNAPTKEAAYFKKLFIEKFGKKNVDVVPHYWLPKWDSSGKEVGEYIDPSARVLKVYSSQ